MFLFGNDMTKDIPKFNGIKTNSILILHIQSVPLSKHTPSRLLKKPTSVNSVQRNIRSFFRRVDYILVLVDFKHA